jgi:hypothetical protein
MFQIRANNLRRISMKRIINSVLIAITAAAFMACQPAANTPSNANANAGNANANVAAKPAPPTKEALTGLEEKAFDAWTKGDAQFFEGFLVDNFVGFGSDGKQIDKAGTVKMIGTEKCEVKSKSFSDQTVTPVGPDAAVITMKVDADVTCGGKKVPNPMITASLYVRSGDTWKGAYHNEVKYVEPKNVKPEVTRFKGLGEMPAEQLKATTLDVKRRRALRVVVDSEIETDRVLNELMGKDAQARFKFIMERARETAVDELDV